MEVGDRVVLGQLENAADGEFHVDRIDVAHERDAVAELQVEPLGQVLADDAGGAVLLEGLLLVFRNPHFADQVEQLLRLDGQAREEVLGVACVFISAAKPLRHHDHARTRDPFDLLAVKQRHGQGE